MLLGCRNLEGFPVFLGSPARGNGPAVLQIRHFVDYFITVVDKWGPLGYLAYGVVYLLLEIVAVPAIPLTMTAGIIFGVIPGTIVVSVAATGAATIAFLIARYAARDRVGPLTNAPPFVAQFREPPEYLKAHERTLFSMCTCCKHLCLFNGSIHRRDVSLSLQVL